MAFLQLISNNPNFSYILEKNPASGMLIKSLRKGRLFAWYTDPKIFNIYFRDSDNEVSFGVDQDFEYMDTTRYNAPIFVNSAIHEFLRHMKKPDDRDIAGYENILRINQMRCKRRNLDAFKSHFQDYEFKIEEVALNNFKIEIKTKKTIRELINLGQILSIFNALLYNDLYITDNDIERYISNLQVIDCPYYIRHLFKMYFLRTEGLFKKYKSLIEKSESAKLEFEFGGTLQQRMRAIKRLLDFRNNIVDIGCGDGDYVREFAPRLKNDSVDLVYHAIDIDSIKIENVKRLCQKKGIDNVAVWNGLEDGFVCPENSDIIMSEVIEHMSREDAESMIKRVLSWPFKSIIITTPNKDFNSNYRLEVEDMRHEDHKFEIGGEEFKIWIEGIAEIACKNKCVLSFFDIGDRINDLRPTLAVMMKMK